METILKVRRLSLKQGRSQRAIAKQLHISRRTINKYLSMEIKEAPAYKRTQSYYPKLGAFIPILKQRLIDEAQLPSKQQLTARRPFEGLRTEGYQGAYCAVATFIRQFKEQYHLSPQITFIPQRFSPAEAYQFASSSETVKLNGQLVKLKVAHVRLCHSRAFFIRAYPNEKLDMLIDAHNQAFAFNDQFLSMMNHFMIEPVTCTPASGWEKGQVERQVRTLRKQLFEPTLVFNNLEDLNGFLLDQCHKIIQTATHPENRSKVINELFKLERPLLVPYHPYAGGRLETVQVSSLSLLSFDGHKYIVPNDWVGKTVTLKTTATEINVFAQGARIAQHQRSFVKNQTTYNPWHYLSTLKKKPGALRNGEPFINWDLPKPIKQLQQPLLKRPKGDRAMVQLLSLIADYGEDLGVTAATIALEEGVPTVEAVLNIIHRLNEPLIPILKINDIPLNTPPQANCQRYNTLLKGMANATA